MANLRPANPEPENTTTECAVGKLNWNPWAGGDDLGDMLDRFLDETASGSGPCGGLGDRSRLWQPTADAYETDGAFVVQMELPGLARENVVLETRGREVWIYGQRCFEKEVGAAYHLLERFHGPFARKFILPEGVEGGEARAVLVNGLLTVTVDRPHPADAPKRRISIHVVED